MKYLIPAGLFVLIIIQWLVPLNMIHENESILKHGKLFRFETMPIDPSMPFTGKYVWLNFKASDYSATTKDSLSSGDDVFVLLENDAAGFAKIKSISKTQPSANTDFVEALCSYTYKIRDTLVASINFPFTKFYMDEYKAPSAETAYRKANLDSSKKTFALVNVLNGKAVIKDVMIDDKSLKDIVKQQK